MCGTNPPVWCRSLGFEKLKDIDIFHRNFLHIILKTFKSTPNCMLYENTGSIDMITQVHKKMVNFWLKMKFSSEEKCSSVLGEFLSNLSSEAPELHNFKWCKKIKNILNHIGFSDAWYAQSMDLKYFKTIFAQRSNDIFMQK